VISAPPPPTTIHVENIDPTTLTAVKTVGHPKGTTFVNLREQQLKYKALVDNVAMQWNSLKYEYKRQRVPKNMLDDFIAKNIEESGLENVIITKNAIRKRVQKQTYHQKSWCYVPNGRC
jgi:L-lactate utilization protein LutC